MVEVWLLLGLPGFSVDQKKGGAAGAGTEFSFPWAIFPWAMAVAMSVRADSSRSFLSTMAEIAALIC